jgi:hypothetical protein
MKFTRHAKVRQRQRGWSDRMVGILLEWGRLEPAPGGAVRVFLGKREAQKIDEEISAFRKLVERAKGGSMVIKDDCVLTLCWNSWRAKRKGGWR